jgi:uncharacterized protein
MTLFGFDLSAMLPFIAIGFGAQLVDGALGMAFGVIANTSLLWMGVPPAIATSYVHVIKSFTGGVSGVSHILHKNVDWKLFARLAFAGVAGGVFGAWLLSQLHVANSDLARPFVQGYLALIGLYIFWRGLGHKITERRAKVVEPVALIGGFLDSTGGGGWGPVVTSNLLIQGNNPRMTVGTVNTAEFVIAVAVSITYLLSLGIKDLTAPVVGLLLGGVAAAPLASWITKHVPARRMMVLVGILLTTISLFGLAKTFGLV